MEQSKHRGNRRATARRALAGALVVASVAAACSTESAAPPETITPSTTEATSPPTTPTATTSVAAATTSTTDVATTPPPETTTTTEPPPPEPEPLPGLLPVPDPLPLPPTAPLAEVPLRLERVLSISNLTGIQWSVLHDSYYAITQDGYVHRIPAELGSSEVVLDMSAEVTELLSGSERGMLGIAIDPADGRMFLHFTDRTNNTHVVSLGMVDGRPDPTDRRAVLFLEQPGLGHQGGAMRFGDAGHLFIAFGDGGGSRGRDAQDYSKLFGAIIRIVPNRDGDGYTVPDDNPYAGDPERRGEIWVKGLRNPWQFSINRATGDMWIGDVGEDTFEELNFVPAGTSGQNFGWYWFEGTRDRGIGSIPEGLELTPPVYEWDRRVGVASIAGVVYHGTAIPGLRGAFVFADMSGPVFAYGAEGGIRLGVNSSGVLTSFAETPDGEILVTTLRNGLFRLLPA